ncbi:hypothetical protein SAMD00019534_099620 [Acytostelium subglobosum LB1]|uniref:hypothetical protein n=1 Tax=Acytostelium subglobosum LB1 TaxID=1410327 RepID=UPI000645179B|nr:hypothetical protein SAMD00019534_099620 [Acytostelium subglobosum LB1]GAM26787.1 hypothetical protein SAMD00019534_099620 [Acytostelium subglobosum LB1]|eukprot:XP_012750448.1 hypothetical protein SAMD00019534_099620 [Acytostelium subglobosum LB1]
MSPRPTAKQLGSDPSMAEIQPPKPSLSLRKMSDTLLGEYRNAPSGQYVDIRRLVEKIKVTKRRLYEIMSIMEYFGVVRKEVRDTYYWTGLNNIAQAVQTKVFDAPPDQQPHKTSFTNLCHRLVCLFVSRPVLSIVDARDELGLGSMPARCKRLYDIANILESLGLIAKSVKVGGKQLYMWQGPLPPASTTSPVSVTTTPL